MYAIMNSSKIFKSSSLLTLITQILHGCTHPNNDAVSASLSERDVFLGIFHYIDRIVSHIVRPKKTLFMAIDGVAPRAKMNQQRSRRFRSARDAAEAREQMEQDGADIPSSSETFDSNCITPGTLFMQKVSRHLRYFIRKKMNEDPLWAGLDITFSGHEVPGEGEHKIMQYIRDERASGRLDPNTRHCMYGQDADLIMLGLISHEPHFTLLREVVDFGSFSRGTSKNAVKVVMRSTRDAVFQLLHLSILREYLWSELTLDMSLEQAKDANLERWLDDFVFITFLIGNDFLPHMPSLDIGEEAFDLLFRTYRTQFPSWGGNYLTKDGSIDDPDRLECFLAAIGGLEDKIFEEREVSEAGFRARRRKAGSRFGGPAGPTEEELEAAKNAEQAAYEAALGVTPGSREHDFKGRYYYTKFGITPDDKDVHRKLRLHYVEGLQWCLAYYYRGCVSWSWFYPFHYVPMISDLTNLRSLLAEVSFTLGAPFLPFQQLLSCLPPASSWCLPTSYSSLMTHPDSPILDFYPTDFKIDPNGKRNPWEAVNLLPFIDAQRMFDAVEQMCPPDKLTKEERDRNTFGQVLIYQSDPNCTETILSCNPEIGLKDIPRCGSVECVGTWSIESTTSFTSELRSGVVIPLAGFPSLHSLAIPSVDIRPIKLNVFGTDSRYKTMVLSVQGLQPNVDMEQLAQVALGRSVYVNWPLAHEARVVALSDGEKEVRRHLDGTIKVTQWEPKERDAWRMKSQMEAAAYTKGRAVPGSGGAEIGAISVRLKVVPLQGMSPEAETGALQKVFGVKEAEVPLQMVMWKSPAPDPRFQERGPPPLEESLPLGCSILCLGSGPLRGCKGKVMKHLESGQVAIRVEVRPAEPPFGVNVAASVQETFIPAHDVVNQVGLRPDILGKVLGSLVVNPGRYDIGLNLKANGRYYTLGYARPRLRAAAAWTQGDTVQIIGSIEEEPDRLDAEFAGWELSPKAVRLVQTYMQQFPALFQGLASVPNERTLSATDLFGPGRERMLEGILQWLETLPSARITRVPLTTTALSWDAVQAVERAADVRQRLLYERMTTKEAILPFRELVRFNSIDHTHAARDSSHDELMNPKEQPLLGDRVVNLCARGVPFGMWGTVIALHRHSGCVEVVFDEEFIGGGALQGMCSNYRGALVPWAAVAKLQPAVTVKVVAKKASKQRCPQNCLSRTPLVKRTGATPSPVVPFHEPERHPPAAEGLLKATLGMNLVADSKALPDVINSERMAAAGASSHLKRILGLDSAPGLRAAGGDFDSQSKDGPIGTAPAGTPSTGSSSDADGKVALKLLLQKARAQGAAKLMDQRKMSADLPADGGSTVTASTKKGKKYRIAIGPDEGMRGFVAGRGRGGSNGDPHTLNKPGGLKEHSRSPTHTSRALPAPPVRNPLPPSAEHNPSAPQALSQKDESSLSAAKSLLASALGMGPERTNPNPTSPTPTDALKGLLGFTPTTSTAGSNNPAPSAVLMNALGIVAPREQPTSASQAGNKANSAATHGVTVARRKSSSGMLIPSAALLKSRKPKPSGQPE
jgi:5'-3' exoribonuclease 1